MTPADRTHLVIRFCSRAELDCLVRQCFPPGLRASLAMATSFMPGMSYRVATIDNQPAGGIIVRSGARRWEIVSVMVSPRHRRLGIAAALIRNLMADTDALGVEIIAFVRKNNPSSRSLFQTLGFLQAKVWAFPFFFEEILPWGDHFVRTSSKNLG